MPIKPIPSERKAPPTSYHESILKRPESAHGTFLRIIMCNDVYELQNYPHFASCVIKAREESERLDCKVISTLNGDFVGPCLMTSLDGGKTMVEALSHAQVDYACFGNHEFDLGFEGLKTQMRTYTNGGGVLVNSNCNTKQFENMPKYQVIDIGSRKCVLGGFALKISRYMFLLPHLTWYPSMSLLPQFGVKPRQIRVVILIFLYP